MSCSGKAVLHQCRNFPCAARTYDLISKPSLLGASRKACKAIDRIRTYLCGAEPSKPSPLRVKSYVTSRSAARQNLPQITQNWYYTFQWLISSLCGMFEAGLSTQRAARAAAAQDGLRSTAYTSHENSRPSPLPTSSTTHTQRRPTPRRQLAWLTARRPLSARRRPGPPLK